MQLLLWNEMQHFVTVVFFITNTIPCLPRNSAYFYLSVFPNKTLDLQYMTIYVAARLIGFRTLFMLFCFCYVFIYIYYDEISTELSKCGDDQTTLMWTNSRIFRATYIVWCSYTFLYVEYLFLKSISLCVGCISGASLDQEYWRGKRGIKQL